MLHIHEGSGLDAALSLKKALERRQEVDKIAVLAYRLYLEGRGEEAAEVYVSWIMGEISREEALERLERLLAEARRGPG